MGARAKDRDGSDRLWRWAALLLGGLVLGLGCGPANLAYLMLPFEPDTPAECELASKDKKKEVKVVTLVSYAGAPDVTPELLTADQELAERFYVLLRKRMDEKKAKVKLVRPYEVKAYQNKEDWRTLTLAEIGKHFQADKVISLEINSMSLHERHSPMPFKGNVDISITVNDLTVPADEPQEIFRKPYLKEFPKMKIIPSDSAGGAPYFRALFINRICEDLVDTFTTHGSPVGNQKLSDES
jgi:hypothetical protein